MEIKKSIILLSLLLVLAVPLFAQDCYESSIVRPYPFMGNDGEAFRLSDGTEWTVVQDRVFYYLYEYRPKIIICPEKGQMMVGGKIVTVVRKGTELENIPGIPVQ